MILGRHEIQDKRTLSDVEDRGILRQLAPVLTFALLLSNLENPVPISSCRCSALQALSASGTHVTRYFFGDLFTVGQVKGLLLVIRNDSSKGASGP